MLIAPAIFFYVGHFVFIIFFRLAFSAYFSMRTNLGKDLWALQNIFEMFMFLNE